MQAFKVTTHVYHDVPDDGNGYIGGEAEVEYLPHDCPMEAKDWGSRGDLVMYEVDGQGRFARAEYQRFASEYDRNAEAWFPILVETVVERVDAREAA